MTFQVGVTFELWVTCDFIIKYELWVNFGGGVRCTCRHTHRHINTMTWPGLGAGFTALLAGLFQHAGCVELLFFLQCLERQHLAGGELKLMVKGDMSQVSSVKCDESGVKCDESGVKCKV